MESAEDSSDSEMRVRAGSSAPIFKLKAQLEKAAPALEVADGLMLPTPPGTATDANVDPTSPAALNAQKAPEPVMDAAAVRASHLYIGYEDPNHLPDGTEIKPKVDTSGTIGTEAGTDFNYVCATPSPTAPAARRPRSQADPHECSPHPLFFLAPSLCRSFPSVAFGGG